MTNKSFISTFKSQNQKIYEQEVEQFNVTLKF